MGYENLWQQYRDHFPVTAHLVYLNHAAVAPLCRRAADAMKGLADDACLYGSIHYEQWMASYEGLRQATATLIGSSPREIALVKNTSEGVATVGAGGLGLGRAVKTAPADSGVVANGAIRQVQ